MAKKKPINHNQDYIDTCSQESLRYVYMYLENVILRIHKDILYINLKLIRDLMESATQRKMLLEFSDLLKKYQPRQFRTSRGLTGSNKDRIGAQHYIALYSILLVVTL